MRSRPGFVVPHLGGAFSPTDIAGLWAWHDASDTATITGTSVSQWDDKSGNGLHVTQGTGTNQPRSGTNTLGGLNVIDFNNDGTVDNYLQRTGITGASAPFTVFVVCKITSVINQYSVIAALNTGTNAPQPVSYEAAPGPAKFYANDSGGQHYFGSTTASNTAVIVEVVINGASSLINVNGGTPATFTAGSWSSLTAIQYGISATYMSKVDLGESIIYNAALGTTDRDSLRTYLNDKWSVY